MKSSVTLKDIAKAAGLSVSAVCMALADYPQISDETKQRVRELSRQLNYQKARRRPRTTQVRRGPYIRISLVLANVDIEHFPGYMERLHLLTQVGQEMEVKMEVTSLLGDDPQQARRQLQEHARGLEGLLLDGYASPELIEQLSELNLPCVLIGRPHADPDWQIQHCICVQSDAEAMGHVATRSLIAQGHQRIGFLAGNLPVGLWYERWHAGYERAHREAGLAVDPVLTQPGPGSQLHLGEPAAHAFAALTHPPTAFVAPDDLNGSALLQAMSAMGRPIPRDAIVMGGSIDSVRQYQVEHYPLILEDARLLTTTAVRLLQLAAEGRRVPPGCFVLPFQTRNVYGTPSPAEAEAATVSA